MASSDVGSELYPADPIAREAGILVDGDGGLVLEGPVFRKMSQKEKEAVAVKIRVLARSSPTVEAFMREHALDRR